MLLTGHQNLVAFFVAIKKIVCYGLFLEALLECIKKEKSFLNISEL